MCQVYLNKSIFINKKIKNEIYLILQTIRYYKIIKIYLTNKNIIKKQLVLKNIFNFTNNYILSNIVSNNNN